MTSAIEVQHLRAGYRRDLAWRATEVIHDVSFTVPEGSFFGFLGHNGAGKTTTMKALLGLLTPAAGKVLLFGKDPRDPSARRPIGYLPEHPYFYDHLTVTELLQLYGELAGIARHQLQASVMVALERVQLVNKAHARMRSLSKGLTQRVGVAQSIIANPRLLLLDEPFSGLDPIGRKALRELLVDVHRSGTTIFMSSHMLSDVEFLCSQAAILAHGTLRGVVPLGAQQQGLSAEYELTLCATQEYTTTLRERAMSYREEGQLLRLRYRDRALAEEALRASLDAGLAVHGFERLSRSLEELFVELVSAKPPRSEVQP